MTPVNTTVIAQGTNRTGDRVTVIYVAPEGRNPHYVVTATGSLPSRAQFEDLGSAMARFARWTGGIAQHRAS